MAKKRTLTPREEYEKLKKDPAYRAGCQLRAALERTVPDGILALLTDQSNTYLGETFSDVVRFALIDWVLSNASKLPRQRNRDGFLRNV